MTTQLVVAEQLSESLSKLMTDLSIDSPAKGQNIRKELFETIGLPYDGASHKSPAREKAENTPFNKELSVFLAVKERSRRKKPSPVKSLEPETARRRRDSLDRVIFQPSLEMLIKFLQLDTWNTFRWATALLHKTSYLLLLFIADLTTLKLSLLHLLCT